MSIKSLIHKAIDIASEIFDDSEKPSNSETSGFVSEAEHEDLKRRYWEQFKVVEKVLKERDQWRDLYKEHVEQHLNAQIMLSNSLVRWKQQVATLFAALNKLREEKGEKPLKELRDLLPVDGQLTDLPEKYVERMTKAHAALVSSFDALGERDRVSAGLSR